MPRARNPRNKTTSTHRSAPRAHRSRDRAAALRAASRCRSVDVSGRSSMGRWWIQQSCRAGNQALFVCCAPACASNAKGIMPRMDNRTTARADLYPAIEPFDSGMLPLDDVHTMYWEVSGNPHGVPVVFLHGGPGGGCSPEHRRFFDPAFFRIVLFDQRGAGASTPSGETRQNTTSHLVRDVEKLRAHLGVNKWLVFGGS